VTRRRAAIAVTLALLLAGSTLLALLASDVLAWQERVRAQDALFERGDAGASWSIDAAFPFRAARGLLGIDGDLAYRRALQLYRTRNSSPLYNGVERRAAQAEAAVALANVEQADPNAARASQAANLLGILALSAPSPIAPGQPSPVESATAEFQNAIRLDPANEDAKYNLELLLRETEARGEREGGEAGQTGRSSGRRGAGSSPPGRGY
jgi:hypothetical protein